MTEVKAQIEKLLVGKKFYQPVKGFPQCTGRGGTKGIAEFDKRLNYILKEFPPENKRFLVMACNVGYNVLSIAERGGNVVGVEKGEYLHKITKLLQTYHNVPEPDVQFIHDTAQHFTATNKTKFDYIVYLMIMHHLITPNPVALDSAFKVLNYAANMGKKTVMQLRCWRKFPELGMHTQEDIPKFIIRNTDFTNYKHIEIEGGTKERPAIIFNLPLWVLWKE